eukprot:7489709-Pyramimonas_sp.AAC.2
MEGRGALGQVDEESPGGPAGLARWACVETSAKIFLGDPVKAGAVRPRRSGIAQPFKCARKWPLPRSRIPTE